MSLQHWLLRYIFPIFSVYISEIYTNIAKLQLNLLRKILTNNLNVSMNLLFTLLDNETQ